MFSSPINGISKLHYWLMLTFSFSISLSDFFSLRLLILLAVISTLINFKSIGKFILRQWEVLLYFVVLLTGLVYSTDLMKGLRLIETSASLLLVPLVFHQHVITEKIKAEDIFISFIAGVIVSCLICLAYAFTTFLQTGDINRFLYYNFTQIVDVHPTYIAYYIIFSITWFLHKLYFNFNQSNRIIIHIVVFFLFGVLLLTGGQTSFISLLLVFSFFILKFILESRLNIKVFTIIQIGVMLVMMFTVSSRISNSDLNDSWDRFSLWGAGIQANSNPFIGEGTGGYQDVLNKYYENHQMLDYAETSMNSHNQFIQVYFSNGLIGLVSILLLLSIPIYKSFKMGSSLGILIFFPFLVYGMTEVFLGRYEGVVFFALLRQVFLCYLSVEKAEYNLYS
jgi:O-antigen ligase